MIYKSQALEQSDKATFFNVIPSRKDERDWNAEPLYDDVKSVPNSLDWRKHLQRVRNQGIQGTSLAFVGACMVEWYTRKILKEPIEASPQYLYNSRNNQSSTLLCGRDMMKILKDHGCCKEESYLYGCKDEISEEIRLEASSHKIDGYARMRTMETLKKALLINGPCLICFPVYNHTTNLWKQRKEEEKLGCHAMCVVGYNSRGFILRNSWGEHWDNNGYCIYPYSDWGCHDEIWTVVSESNMKRWKVRVNSIVLKAFSDKTSNMSKRPNSEGGLPVPRKRMSTRMSIFQSTVPENSIQNAAHYTEDFSSKESFSGTNEMKKGFMSKWFGKKKGSKKAKSEEPVEKTEEQTDAEAVDEDEKVEEEVVEEQVEEAEE